MNPFDRAMWAYRAVFTQANAGGGSIVVNIMAKGRCVLLYGTIGPDDYAAGRSTLTIVKDAVGGNIIYKTLVPISIDNARVPLWLDGTTLADNEIGKLDQHLILADGEVLGIEASSLVQNETLTITVRGLIETQKPDITTTGSGGTVTVVTTYNKVI